MSNRIVIRLLYSLIEMRSGYTASALVIRFKETCEFIHCNCFIEGTCSMLRLYIHMRMKTQVSKI